MLSKSRSFATLGLVLTSSLLFAGCAQAAETATASTPEPTAVSTQPLLDKATTTVLGQPLSYPSDTQAQISSSIITVPHNMEVPLHLHDAPMYAYILEGTLTVNYDDGTVKTYHEGDALMEAIDLPHYGKNTGSGPVRILVVNIGAENVANTVPLP